MKRKATITSVSSALVDTRDEFYKTLQSKLAQWRLPFYDLNLNLKGKMVMRLQTKLNRKLSNSRIEIPQGQLELLARGFLDSNLHKSTILYFTSP